MNVSDVNISKLLIHYVGNKSHGENVRISKRKVNISDQSTHDKLKSFYFSPLLKLNEFFQFSHPSSLKFNEIYNYVTSVFENESTFSNISSDIATHLFECSVHPKIKSGELHLVYFKGIIVEEKELDALGIFKTETKIDFIKLNKDNSGYDIEFNEGINPFDGFDKGCLILNVNKKEGYKILIIDNQSKSQEAQYWKDDFLNIKPCSDSYHHTKNYLNICKDFLSSQLPKDFEVTKAEQIDLLNRSISYFKEADNFNEKDFTKTVLEQPEIIKSFKEFKQDFIEQNELDIEEQFDISASAVKKQTRIFKSVLKLDRNFHIYIHGDKDLIEKGIENNGRKFYKIYYDEES